MKLDYRLVVTIPPTAPLYHTSVKTGSVSMKQESAGCIRFWNLSQGYGEFSKTLFTCYFNMNFVKNGIERSRGRGKFIYNY